MPQIIDPVFSKALIFMIEHNESGAFGVIINKKITRGNYKMIKDFLPNNRGLFAENSEDLFFGGPIRTKEDIILKSFPKEFFKPSISPLGISKANDKKRLEKNTENQILSKKITGCSSWGPGQLEKEMKNGDWLPQEKHNNIIFCNNPENNWGSMMKSIGFDTIDIISKGAQA